MDGDGSRNIPIQEEYRWIDAGEYLYTRGLEGGMDLSIYKRDKVFLTYIPSSQSERNGSKVLATTGAFLYKST